MSPTVYDVYPDRWMKAADLKGQQQILTIQRAAIENIYNTRTNKDIPKIVLRFAETPLALVLNKTQSFDLVDKLGTDDYTHWIGGKLKIKPGKAHNNRPTIVITAAQMPPPPPPPTP